MVEDGRNGILLNEVTSGALESALRRCLDSPGLLAAISEASGAGNQFTLASLESWFSGFPAYAHLTERMASFQQ